MNPRNRENMCVKRSRNHVFVLNARIATSTTENYGQPAIEIDGVTEYEPERIDVEIPLSSGGERAFYQRRAVIVPWTPRLFIATTRDAVNTVRRDVNLHAVLNARTASRTGDYDVTTVIDNSFDGDTVRTVIEHCVVDTLLRDATSVMWTNAPGRRVFEFRFDTWGAYRQALNFLRDNATNKQREYTIFANNENVALQISLTAHFAADNGTKTRVVDLERAFTYGTWCCYDADRGNALRRLTDREIAANSLPDEPLSAMDVVSYDIETIARADSILPRGTEPDQRISSFSVSINRDASIVFAYCPVNDEKELERYETMLQQALLSHRIAITLFSNERTMLRAIVDTMSRNRFLAGTRNIATRDTEHVCVLLLGYNSWGYDHDFLVTRLVFHGMYDLAMRISRYRDEPRFGDSQISFDLMKHVIARHRAQVGSVSLANVSRFFGPKTDSDETRRKMDVDSVAIRHLYYDTVAQTERFDATRAFDLTAKAESTPPSLRVCAMYNATDCLAVYHLARNINFVDCAIAYARHFFTPVVKSSYCGNSQLLPNAIVARALATNALIIPYRDVELLGVRRCSRRRRDEYSFDVRSLRDAETTGTSMYDEADVMRISRGKLYVGGINSAISGHYTRTSAVDFASFYPSIGRAYKLSMETARVCTQRQFVDEMAATDAEIRCVDAAITVGAMRVFEYEPVGSTAVNENAEGAWERDETPARMSRLVRLARESMARQSGKRFGWYEGMELFDLREILDSSRHDRRRILVVVHSTPTREPVTCALWRYYLARRIEYKTLLKQWRRSDGTSRSVLVCMEKMYKVTANSLYGYLNFRHSVIYAPAVAAAITLLARKMFHEMTWLYERDGYLREEPRAHVTVYRDTDGAMFRPTDQRDTDDGESLGARLERVNEELREAQRVATWPNGQGPDVISIALESEYEEARLCTIMGKKKYWLLESDGNVTSKGFEKNSQAFVKRLVRVLQINVARIVERAASTRRKQAFRIVLRDVRAFFVRVYAFLDRYREQHGTDEFAFNMPLNPRRYQCESEEASFAQRTLSSNDYDPGDRVRCVYVIDELDPLATRVRLASETSPNDRVNYYKSIRRVAMYLLQIVEGFKRHDTENIGEEYTTAKAFDEILRDAFLDWWTIVRESSNETSRKDAFRENPYNECLFDEERSFADNHATVLDGNDASMDDSTCMRIVDVV